MGAKIKTLSIIVLLGLAVFPVCATAEAPYGLAADEKDFCRYLKDVEAETDAACTPDALAALKAQDPPAFAQKRTLVLKRKADVKAVYEYLKALPPPDNAVKASAGEAAKQLPPDRLRLTPPVNARTFPVWIGTEDKDFKSVYARWLQVQNAKLERKQKVSVSDERRQQIAAQLTQNKAKLASLRKIKDPAQLSCYLGEKCGVRTDVSGPVVVGPRRGKKWTAADFARANVQARNENGVHGGKLDRVIPSLSAVTSEVVSNSPLGPLTGQPADMGNPPVRTAAELALVATGALLLFGGLAGKQLEAKVPGIRRNMGIAALVGGTLATGALAWEASMARAAAAALPVAANPAIKEEASEAAAAALQTLRPAVERAAEAAEAESPAAFPKSVEQAGRVEEHLRQWKEYGQGGYRELENGAIRYYGQVRNARTPGEMIGQRTVREWDPLAGTARTWLETIDRSGAIRIVRPETGAPKMHYLFDQAGNYIGSK